MKGFQHLYPNIFAIVLDSGEDVKDITYVFREENVWSNYCSLSRLAKKLNAEISIHPAYIDALTGRIYASSIVYDPKTFYLISK